MIKHSILLLCLPFIYCTPVLNKQIKEIKSNSSFEKSFEIEERLKNMSIQNQLIADTIRYQIGGKLYYKGTVDSINPKDSITVLDKFYMSSYSYRQYEFIIHNKQTPFHEAFSTKSLLRYYQAYLVEDKDYPYCYSKDYNSFYKNRIKEQRDKAKNISINPAISKYEGFWICLRKIDNQFYIDDIWAWLYSFRIKDGVCVNHYMDGIYPSLIETFEVDKDGSFRMKIMGEESSMVEYKLIDKKLKIYQVNNDTYITSSDNIHSFEIIEYANNTGDLI